MLKNKYRLQPVLEVRGRSKEQAALFVSKCRAQLEHEEEELARRLQSIADCRARQATARERMSEQESAGTTAHNLLAHRTYLADLRRSEQALTILAEQQRASVVQAASELDRAMRALIEASKELKVVETHRENWRQQRRVDEARSEQKSQDEIGSILHRLRSHK